MTHTTYRFDHLWRLRAPREQVYAALADVDGYARWWPQIREIHRIDADSGRVRIRSLLPYTLNLVLTRAIQDETRGILRVDVDGDLRGWCAWQLTAEGTGTSRPFQPRRSRSRCPCCNGRPSPPDPCCAPTTPT